MIDFLPLAILSLASYRLTRFFLFDTLIEGARIRWYNALLGGTRLSFLRQKAVELTSCSWCLGIWVSLAVLSLYLKNYPWDFTVNNWISLFAVAGVQGYLHALEPGDED